LIDDLKLPNSWLGVTTIINFQLWMLQFSILISVRQKRILIPAFVIFLIILSIDVHYQYRVMAHLSLTW